MTITSRVAVEVAGAGVAAVVGVAAVLQERMTLETGAVVGILTVTITSVVTVGLHLLTRRWKREDKRLEGGASIEIEHIKGLRATQDRQIKEIEEQQNRITELRKRIEELEEGRAKTRARDTLIRAIMIALTDEVSQLVRLIGSRYPDDDELERRAETLARRTHEGLDLYEQEGVA